MNHEFYSHHGIQFFFILLEIKTCILLIPYQTNAQFFIIYNTIETCGEIFSHRSQRFIMVLKDFVENIRRIIKKIRRIHTLWFIFYYGI